MYHPSDEDIDRIAAEAAGDLRTLAGIWNREGAAALDAVVRNDPRLTFAVVDARAAGGVIRLVGLRRTSRALLLMFGEAVDGARSIVARGLTSFHRILLVADTEFSEVNVSDSADTSPPGDADSERLAVALAWHFDVGISHVARSPAAFAPLPADFQPENPQETFEYFVPGLLAALDTADDLLMGNISYFEGIRSIAIYHRWGCGLPVRDRDLSAIWVIDSMRDDIDKAFEFHREQKGGAWTWSDEVASFEAYARKNAEPHVRSLLNRFRGDAFARL
jgi:hypothetical protein